MRSHHLRLTLSDGRIANLSALSSEAGKQPTCAHSFAKFQLHVRSQSLRSLLVKQLKRLRPISILVQCSVPVYSITLCLDLGCLERGFRWVPGVALDGILRRVMFLGSVSLVMPRSPRQALATCALFEFDGSPTLC